MTGIQIPVDANISALQKKIDALGRKIDEINKKKWSPIDPAAIERDAKKVELTINGARQRALPSTASWAAPSGGAPSAPPTPAGSPPAPPVPARRPGEYGIRRRYTYAPEWSDISHGAMGGLGGGFAQIAGSGSRGAIAGAQGGAGLGGGLMGLLRGTAIGALAFGAFKAASVVSEGVDMARERAGTLDTLKRQMGDVGISFERLKVASDSAAYGLGINSKDFAVLEQQMNVASRGADKDPLSLLNATSVAAGFGRSYGMDPGAAANIFGSARNIDQRANYRQFALILAETIEKTGMSSRADEVMQAVLSFASTASRISLSAANTGAFAGAYSGLINSGVPGMTPEVAQQILGQANSAAVNMGAAGEAGQAFTLAAFQRSGRSLNPLEASAEASGGLFGSRSSVFGAGSEMEKLLGSDTAIKLAGGPGANTTNFEMILAHARRLTGNGTQGKELQAEMLQRYFGLQSIQQAAALMNLQDSGQMGGLSQQIKSAGIDPSRINFTNIQTLAKIGNASGMGGLDAIYGDLKTRTGTSALTKGDTANIDSARDRGESAYRNALFTAANGKDQAQDMATVARDSKAVLDNIQINTGDKLLGAITGFQDDMISLLGGKKKLDEGRHADMVYSADFTRQGALDKENLRYATEKLRDEALSPDNPMDAKRWVPLADNEKAHKDALASIEANYKQAMAAANAPNAANGGAPSTQSHDINVNVRQVGPSGQTTTLHQQTVTIGPPRGSGSVTNVPAS